jgi:hypothetical protein
MSVIIFFIAVAFSDRNGFSSVRIACVLEGSFAKANDVAVTDDVITSETRRFRMKERENNTIITSGFYQPLPARMAPRPGLVFPRYMLLKGRPTKTPAVQSRLRDALEHGGRRPASQLKTDLHS